MGDDKIADGFGTSTEDQLARAVEQAKNTPHPDYVRVRNPSPPIHLHHGVEVPEVVDVPEVTDLALDLAALRARPRGTSPLEGLLPEEPALVLLVSRPKVGKTRLALTLAQAAAARVAPWPDAQPLDLGRVAVVEAEEPGIDTVRTLDLLALMAHRDRASWESRLLLFAGDRELDERAIPLLRLDSEGLALLRRLARGCGLIVLDSLSRLKPPGVEERDNDHMTMLLDELQRIAYEESCYLLLLHHEGHADRDDPVSAGRGASAISAVARVVWRLDRVPAQSRHRRLRVRGNAVPDAEVTFEVASEEAQPEGVLLYWRPVDPLAGVAVEDVLPEIGFECTTTDLARALAGSDDKPSGRTSREAAALRTRWKREGLVAVVDGPRNAKLIRRLR